MLSADVVEHYRAVRYTNALAEECATRGYPATTIAHVVARAATSRGAVYARFANKAAIFDALVERVTEELFERVEDACASEEDLEARIGAGLGALLAWVAAEPASASAILVESIRATPASVERYFETLDRFAAMLATAAPSDADRPAHITELLVGVVALVLRDLLTAGEAENAPALGPDFLNLLRAPFRIPTIASAGISKGPGDVASSP